MQMDIHAVLKVYSFSLSSLFFYAQFIYLYYAYCVFLFYVMLKKSNALSVDLFEIVEK